MLSVLGITAFNWIYSEAGHGKGAPDGVGAAAKRVADAHVAHGGSVVSAADIVKLLRRSSIDVVREVSY
jgi:heptaprenylglyceryl phosphate synthase